MLSVFLSFFSTWNTAKVAGEVAQGCSCPGLPSSESRGSLLEVKLRPSKHFTTEPSSQASGAQVSSSQF